MPSVTIQVVSDHNFLTKLADPRFWEVYRMYVIREITEGALDTIRSYASRLWKNPSGGGLDQSWFSRYDLAKGMGFISNSKPYAYWQNVGVRPHKMVYLLNAKNAWYLGHGPLREGAKAAIIPIKTGPGKGDVLFRTVTEEQMARNPGGPPWWHPGLAPKNFLEKGMEEFRQTKLKTTFDGLIVRVLGLTR